MTPLSPNVDLRSDALEECVSKSGPQKNFLPLILLHCLTSARPHSSHEVQASPSPLLHHSPPRLPESGHNNIVANPPPPPLQLMCDNWLDPKKSPFAPDSPPHPSPLSSSSPSSPMSSPQYVPPWAASCTAVPDPSTARTAPHPVFLPRSTVTGEEAEGVDCWLYWHSSSACCSCRSSSFSTASQVGIGADLFRRVLFCCHLALRIDDFVATLLRFYLGQFSVMQCI
jgi:hypothetical protein